MPGPKYTIDTHPKRAEIIKTMCKGDESLRSIADRFKIPKSCLVRYLNDKLIGAAAKVQAEKEAKGGESLLDRVESLMGRMFKLYDAADDYLKDPADPTKYTLQPHAHEIDVIYVTYVTGPKGGKKAVMHKEPLQDLINKNLPKDGEWLEVKYRHSDPRKLIIDAHNALSRDLELVGKITEQVKDIQVNNYNSVTVNQVIVDVRVLIARVLRKHPEALTDLIKALDELEKPA